MLALPFVIALTGLCSAKVLEDPHLLNKSHLDRHALYRQHCEGADVDPRWPCFTFWNGNLNGSFLTTTPQIGTDYSVRLYPKDDNNRKGETLS